MLVKRIYAYTDRVAARHPEIEFVKAPYLNDHPAVLDAFAERVEETLHGANLMNCKLCKYRERILGFEAEKGLPQESHHHHVEGIGTGSGEDPTSAQDHDHAHAHGHGHESSSLDHHGQDHDHPHAGHDHDSGRHSRPFHGHHHGEGDHSHDHPHDHGHHHPYPHAGHPLGPKTLEGNEG